MRFEHQSNYQGPPRHHHGPGPAPMMRPSMHDNYGMRHQRPPMNHLANAVTQNIQQRYGTGFVCTGGLTCTIFILTRVHSF